MKKTIFIIAVLLLALNTHAEFAGNFNPTADCFVPAKEAYTLTNETGTQQTFTIASAGNQKEWINLEGQWIFEQPLTVILAAGKSKQLFAFLKPQNCYVEPGTYPIDVKIKSGEEITRTINLKVVPIRTLSLDTNKTEVEVTQCKEAFFDLNITNTGESNELVELKTDGIASEWTSLSETQFMLEKGKKREFRLTVKPACNAEVKSHGFRLQAFLAGTSFFISKSLYLKIADSQKLELSKSQLTACNDERTTADFTIKNTGTLNDQIQLRVEGADWITVDRKDLNIAAGKNEELKFIFKENDANQGDYKFTLIAFSPKFNKKTEFPLAVKLSDCYGIIIEDNKTDQNKAFDANTQACLEETATVKTTMKNTKAKPITLNFRLQGAKGSIVPSSITIGSNETKTVETKASFKDENAGQKEFKLLIESEHFSAEQAFKLNAVDCYNLQVDYGGLLNRIDINAEDRKAFTVKLKNAGAREVTVETVVSGEKWVYFQPETRKLAPGQEEGVFLYISPTFDTKEGSHNAKITIKSADFSQTRDINLNVYGGLYSLIGEARITSQSEVKGLSEIAEKIVDLNISLKNDGNNVVRIKGVRVIDFNSAVEFKETTLEPGQTTEFSLRLNLGKGFSKEKFVVPLAFTTDKGDIIKSIGIDLSKPVQVTTLAGLGQTKDLFIIVLGIIVIVLIVLIALRTRKSGKEKTETSMPEPETEKTEEEKPKETKKRTARKKK